MGCDAVGGGHARLVHEYANSDPSTVLSRLRTRDQLRPPGPQPVEYDLLADPDRVERLNAETPQLLSFLVALRLMRSAWRTAVNAKSLTAIIAIDCDGCQVAIEEWPLPLTVFSEPLAMLTMTHGSLMTALDVVKDLRNHVGNAKWMIGLWSRVRANFVSANDASRDLIDVLRANAKKQRPGASLMRLDDLQPNELENLKEAKLVVVCLHGFLGTDVATFADLPIAWQDRIEGKCAEFGGGHGHPCRDCFRGVVQFVGWPHDSLASIENNGLDLAFLLDKVLGGTHAHILFVAHSRGGLVAREACAQIARGAFARLQHSVTKVITLGTPHQGTPLARLPGAIAGAVLFNQLASGVLKAIDRILISMQHRGMLRGLHQLAIAQNDDEDYFHRLHERETRLGKRPTVVAFGGDLSNPNLPTAGGHFMVPNFVINLARHLRTARNDLVVSAGSSMPTWSERREVCCDHVGYLDPPTGKIMEMVLDEIAQTYGSFDEALEQCVKSDASPPAFVPPPINFRP